MGEQNAPDPIEARGEVALPPGVGRVGLGQSAHHVLRLAEGRQRSHEVALGAQDVPDLVQAHGEVALPPGVGRGARHEAFADGQAFLKAAQGGAQVALGHGKVAAELQPQGALAFVTERDLEGVGLGDQGVAFGHHAVVHGGSEQGQEDPRGVVGGDGLACGQDVAPERIEAVPCGASARAGRGPFDLEAGRPQLRRDGRHGGAGELGGEP